jgi:peptidoglycan/LPS O-acetylase OafA/YrhL
VIVIWGHTGLQTPVLGSAGVTIFFFLSGYLITTLLRVEADRRGRISLTDFYLRRIFRILPPLYIVVIALVALSMFGAFTTGMTWLGGLSTGTFWPNYFIIFGGRSGLPWGSNALWSLAVEEHYYLLFPLLYIAMRKWLPRPIHQVLVLVAICVAVMIWRLWLSTHGASWDRLYLSTDTRADSILWGSVLAIGLNPIYGEVRAPAHKWLLTPILIGCAVIFYGVTRLPESWSMVSGYTLQSLALFGVFIPLIIVPQSMIGRLMNWGPVAYVGVISYALYLVHRPILMATESWLPRLPLGATACGILLSLLCAYLMHIWVENPFGRLRKRLSHAGETGDKTNGPGHAWAAHTADISGAS